MNLRKAWNEILKNVSYLFKLEKSLAKPTVQQLETTSICMMDCVMCPYRNMTRVHRNMDFELFKKIVDQIKYNDRLWLHHFGDPLIHPRIVDMVRYVAKKGIKPQISANPNLLTKEISEQLIDAGLHRLQISMDAVNDKQYKYVRGPNADYKKAVKNITDLLEVKKRKKSRMHLIISMIPMKCNKYSVQEFKKIWAEKGAADYVMIKDFITWDGSDIKIVAQGDKDTLSKQFKKGNKGKKCSEPWMKVTITADGNVVPCCFDYDEKYIIGDLKKDSLEEIWNNKKMQLLRRQSRSGNFHHNPLCKDCKEMWDTSIFRFLDLSRIKRLRLKHIRHFYDVFLNLGTYKIKETKNG